MPQSTEGDSGPILVVLGLGNVLSGDDGIGVRLIQSFMESNAEFDGVEFLDAGVGGLRLLNLLEEVPAILAIDAADMSLPPGEFRWITPDKISLEEGNGNKPFSLHDLGFAQTLSMAERFFSRPATVIFAVQPKSVEQSETLTSELEEVFPTLIDEVKRAIVSWGNNRDTIEKILLETEMSKKDEILLNCLQK